MPPDLIRLDRVIAYTELKIEAQTARLQGSDIAPWMQDAIHRRLLHLRQDLDTFRRARSLMAEDEGEPS